MSDAETLTHPVDQVKRVKRRHERGFYDHDTVQALLDPAVLCDVSHVIGGLPCCTPTVFWHEGTTLAWHGSSASRMLRNHSAGQLACHSVAHPR